VKKLGAFHEHNRVTRETGNALHECAKPIICAVNGAALGAGLGLMAASDIFFASENATFGMPEIDVGLAGGAAMVQRMFNKSTARRIMYTGMRLSLGRTAVLRVGTVRIFISERPQEPYDTGVFTHAGVDPAQSKYVLLKSRQHFRAGFEPFARHIVLVSGPGVCSSDYSLFPFKHLPRPMYPLDADASLADSESWCTASIA
jgi:enoyl-CoA hydratase/carnithine racemase